MRNALFADLDYVPATDTRGIGGRESEGHEDPARVEIHFDLQEARDTLAASEGDQDPDREWQSGYVIDSPQGSYTYDPGVTPEDGSVHLVSVPDDRWDNG